MRYLLLAALLGAACTRPQPPPPGSDTTVVDTVRSPADTTAADTLLPVDTIPPTDGTELPHDTVVPPPADTTVPDSQLASTLSAPLPPKAKGISFGGYAAKPCGNYTGGFIGVTPGTIVGVINCARAADRTVVLTLTGGKHDDYKVGGKFSYAAWEKKQEKFGTIPIRAAVHAGVKDGTIGAASVMDEPFNTSPDNSWGPKGSVTKALVDRMCGYVLGQFPTLPVGAVHKPRDFEPAGNYQKCDNIVSQYRINNGSVAQFIAENNAFAKRSGVKIVVSMNVLDGGKKLAGCPQPQTGGKGVSAGASGQNCQMTANDVRTVGKQIIASGCLMVYWRLDGARQQSADYLKALADVAAYGKTLPAKSCKRAA